ncbi:hypothetical protein CBR_g20032 [Chara braunii]|uniref:F-box domain-containing protein n=1 Tax=Chara braunii TaxID=69332 RepID=A0A388KZI8_CHABU|nr:hypothetical protein CBR_g20032 [Chara braunii]|eukprot:GBG75402.1 hypothetical protein CBR_g20032 [Chara braunii]
MARRSEFRRVGIHVNVDKVDHDGPANVVDKDDVIDIPPLLPDWSSLQMDVLAVVLSFLPVRERFRAGSVCQKWRRASLDPGCWREADLRDTEEVNEEIYDQLTRAVIVRSRAHLRSLSLRFCNDGLLKYIGTHCPLLEKIKIDEMDVDDWNRQCHNMNYDFKPSIGAIKRFVQGCPQLRSLHLFVIYEREKKELSEVVRVLMSGFPHLVSLYLDVSSAYLDVSAECSSIFELPIHWKFFQIDIDDIRFMVDHIPNLEVLGLRHACVTDAALHLIGERLQCLRSLFLQFCSDGTREGIRSLKAARKDLNVTVKNRVKNGTTPINPR